jgi:DNA oxidative demethylase
MLPGSSFNSLLLNRYKSGSDNVAWHSDDEKLYGLTPEIASVSFGCDREFLLKKKPNKLLRGLSIHWHLNHS